MVHSSHAISLADLATKSVTHPYLGNIEVHDYAYMHSSNLPQGRSFWLRNRINDMCDFAVTVDSDTGFNAGDLIRELGDHGDTDYAIGIVPVIRDRPGGLSLNVYTSQGKALGPSDCDIRTVKRPAIWAGGFGLAVFNLHWFRSNWPLPFPEQFGGPEDYINQGEDVQMCRSVARRGGKLIPLFVGNTHYDMASHTAIGGTIRYRPHMVID
jgi:hypothetical protein